MGLMRWLFGGGGAGLRTAGDVASSVAEVFVPNATRRDAHRQEAYRAALAQYEAEFAHQRNGRFDRAVDGLNRLPRPALALGTIALFGYAMADPAGFGERMEGLARVPEPLWWILGAVVSFYFGVRELHYMRCRHRPPAGQAQPPREHRDQMPAAIGPDRPAGAAARGHNPAPEEGWGHHHP